MTTTGSDKRFHRKVCAVTVNRLIPRHRRFVILQTKIAFYDIMKKGKNIFTNKNEHVDSSFQCVLFWSDWFHSTGEKENQKNRKCVGIATFSFDFSFSLRRNDSLDNLQQYDANVRLCLHSDKVQKMHKREWHVQEHRTANNWMVFFFFYSF